METVQDPAQEPASPPAKPARSAAGILAAFILIVFVLYVGRLFFITLVTAVLLAFILEPLVGFFMRFKVPRGGASFLACTVMLISLYLAGLGAWSQAVGFLEALPTYTQRLTDLVDSATVRLEEVERAARDLLIPQRVRDAEAAAQKAREEAEAARKAAAKRRRPVVEPPLPLPQEPEVQEVRIRPERSVFVNAVFTYFRGFYDVVLMASFVPFLVYFFLSWRDHFRRSLMNLVEGEKRDVIQRAWEGIATVARAYVVGNFLLGIMLSVVSALIFWFVNIPYWQVMGPVSGFLSLIPYIGLPLAILPPFIAALPVYTGWAAYLVIGTVVALLHMIALNLLYPKLVGGRVHLNPLVVTIALMIWYLIWGGAGLILAIPITAGMKAVFDSIPSLRGYGRLFGEGD
ncbi:MAG: AI-2E family transporter [Bryobacteraceae bacterium]|nr:AI-2E family transporter [Solibacteraceae bacterium]MCL4842742.1 AI-2E family transporter [Bryobacteraceae bacterium]MCO5352206.1 AI-2E family transporter [Bryobacteraceae bacterium]